MEPMVIIFGAAVLPGGVPSPTLLRRVDAAFVFAGRHGRYMPTGGFGRHGPSEASLMRARLMSLGVPADRITCEETADDTLASALACAALLRGHPGPIHAASSLYHLPRCLLLLRMAGIAARACPPPPGPIEPYWALRECAALPWDALLMTLRRSRQRLASWRA